MIKLFGVCETQESETKGILLGFWWDVSVSCRVLDDGFYRGKMVERTLDKLDMVLQLRKLKLFVKAQILGIGMVIIGLI
jgi:hypothetical protein